MALPPLGEDSLRLEHLERKDAKHLYHFINSNRSWLQKFFPITLNENKSEEDSLAYIKQKALLKIEKKEYIFTIKTQRESTILGLVILKELNWNKRRAEVAYCVQQNIRNLGWATLAVNQIVKYAFDSLQLLILESHIHKSNLASIRVAEKCGFEWTKTLSKSHSTSAGICLDMELYEAKNEREVLPLH